MWNDYFSALCDHPADPTSGPLKRWADTQRRNKKRLTTEEQEALESIPGWKWRPTWDEQLAALHEYVAVNNGLPKQTHKLLGRWIRTQRLNKNKLTADKKAALEAIPGWIWKTREVKNKYSWDEQLIALREYVAVNNGLPKQTHKGLGRWISNQRQHKNKLAAEQKAALESIPGWVWKMIEIKNKYSWDEQLAALRKYVAEHNKLPKQAHERLGTWIGTQRKNKDKLTADKQAALEAIPGWVWKTHEIKNKYSWDVQLAALREYVAKHNKLPKFAHERLGTWISTQRSYKDKLTADKQAALEAIPGWVWKMFEIKNKHSWDEQHAALREYVAEHNELPKRIHMRLGLWIQTQRANKDKLTADKQAALEAIPGWVWKTREFKNKYSWDEQLAALREYVAEHNELPKRPHERLGEWIITQRQQYRKQKLSAVRIDLLQSIPTWRW